MRRLGVALCFAFALLMLISYDGERYSVSYGQFPSAVCCLAGLYFTMAHREGIGGDSFEHILLRKQIHAMNWRFVSNKAVALIAMRQVLGCERPRKMIRIKERIDKIHIA